MGPLGSTGLADTRNVIRVQSLAEPPAQAAGADVEKPSWYFEMVNTSLVTLTPETATKILDVGCGAGALGAHLKSGRPDRELWGIEFVPEAAEKAKERLDHVFVGDVEKMSPLPVPKNFFDLIIFGDVLEHLLDPKSVLFRAKEHLSADGIILVCVPNVSHWSVVAPMLAGEFKYEDAGILDKTHMRFYTPNSFRRLLAEAGYEVIDEFSHIMPNEPVCNVLGNAGASFGFNAQAVAENASIYQRLYRAKVA